MAKFEVKVRVVKVLEKPFTIYAKDAEEAEQKAANIAAGWVGVEEAQGFDATEVHW